MDCELTYAARPKLRDMVTALVCSEKLPADDEALAIEKVMKGLKRMKVRNVNGLLQAAKGDEAGVAGVMGRRMLMKVLRVERQGSLGSGAYEEWLVAKRPRRARKTTSIAQEGLKDMVASLVHAERVPDDEVAATIRKVTSGLEVMGVRSVGELHSAAKTDEAKVAKVTGRRMLMKVLRVERQELLGGDAAYEKWFSVKERHRLEEEKAAEDERLATQLDERQKKALAERRKEHADETIKHFVRRKAAQSRREVERELLQPPDTRPPFDPTPLTHEWSVEDDYPWVL